MLKAYKYRLYPTDEQKELINKHIGSCRFVYNLALECKQTAYAGSKINLSCFDLIKQLPDLKEQCEWLNEINSQSLQQSITHLDNAFTRFFKGQKYFKETTSGLLSELFSFFCILITAVFLISFMSDEQIYGINLLFASGNWVVLFLSFIGLIAISFITEKILKGVFILLKMLLWWLVK
jgi:hypothetical protein